MNNLFEKAEAAKHYINSVIGEVKIDLAIITGTGLGEIWEGMEIMHNIDYSSIPHFPKNTVQSHAGSLYISKYKNKTVAVFAGRFHYYEGYSPAIVAFPVRVMHQLGIKSILLTNVAGGTNPAYTQGDLVILKDHINFQSANPLRGMNDMRWGPRFPDFKSVFDQKYIELMERLASQFDLQIHKGVYLALQGPNLETPAEYEMFHTLGADVVGMSTVPEIIAASHMDMRIIALSLVSNVSIPVERMQETTIESVIAMAKKVAPEMNKLIRSFIEHV